MDEAIKKKLSSIAQALVAPGKGILAADESTKTITKRFESINLPSTEENRRLYRQLLFTTPGVEKSISGVIMYEETFYQKNDVGVGFASLLAQKGIIPGIKVDDGTVPMTSDSVETITVGLDGLSERLKNYYQEGARFTKWRAVITIGDGIPTEDCISKNAESLAQFVILSQQQGMVPIVEPEVLMNGNHDIEKCAEVTEKVLQTVFKALEAHQVYLSGMLLKPNMIVPAKQSGTSINPVETAQKTIQVLSNVVPYDVGGIVFLSGGLSPQEATECLNEMNKTTVSWPLSFSFGRALQEPVLNTWLGKPTNVKIAQEAFYKRARLNSLARSGHYQIEMENDGITS